MLVKDKKYSIDELFNAGIISAKAHFYIDVSDKVNSVMKASKLSKGRAIKEVAMNLGIAVSTIYRSITMVDEL